MILHWKKDLRKKHFPTEKERALKIFCFITFYSGNSIYIFYLKKNKKDVSLFNKNARVNIVKVISYENTIDE